MRWRWAEKGEKGDKGDPGDPTSGGVYCLDAVSVDHAATSPVALGTAPAGSLVALVVVCTEAPTGSPALTLGDEDDSDSHISNDMLPTDLNGISIGQEIYYSAEKELRATITSAGTAGKWSVTPRVTVL